jgi:hypothetical protein
MIINQSRIEQAMTYTEYRTLLNELFKINQTTGSNQSKEMLDYAKLNLQRMNRIEKTVVIEDDLKEITKKINQKYIWLTLTEGWCGDAAQILPVFNAVASLNPNIELLVLLRDENLDIMDEYLTNGGRAIPKIIFLEKQNLKELAHWGPRPKEAHELYWGLKNAGKNYEEITTPLHTWYAKDKTQAIQRELKDIMSKL